MQLTEVYQYQSRHLYFENFFSSNQLLRDLEEVMTYACMTVLSNRKGLPSAIKQPGRMKRGDSVKWQSGNLLAISYGTTIVMCESWAQTLTLRMVLRKGKWENRWWMFPAFSPSSITMYTFIKCHAFRVLVWTNYITCCSWISGPNSNRVLYRHIGTIIIVWMENCVWGFKYLCLFQHEMEIVCLEPMVLLINRQYWAEIFAQEPGNGARSMRHAAYRQFVLWRHGRLGHNIRCVIPSCVVWLIGDRFASPDSLHTGYQVSRLAWWGQPLGHASLVSLNQLCWCWQFMLLIPLY